MALITYAFDKWPSQHASPESTAATVCSFRPSLYPHVLPFCDRHMCNLVTYVELWKPPHSRTGDQQLQQWQTATYNPILSTLNEAFGGIWKKQTSFSFQNFLLDVVIYLNTIFFCCYVPFSPFFGAWFVWEMLWQPWTKLLILNFLYLCYSSTWTLAFIAVVIIWLSSSVCHYS